MKANRTPLGEQAQPISCPEGRPKWQHIESRIFDQLECLHGEGTQVLRYRSLSTIIPITIFSNRVATHSKSTLNMIEHGAKNRLATVFWYMSDVEEEARQFSAGWRPGPTPKHEGMQPGLARRSACGKVIVFFNMLPSGELIF